MLHAQNLSYINILYTQKGVSKLFQKIPKNPKSQNFQKIEVLKFNGKIFIIPTKLDFLNNMVHIYFDTDDL
jgi:hypothetical protein